MVVSAMEDFAAIYPLSLDRMKGLQESMAALFSIIIGVVWPVSIVKGGEWRDLDEDLGMTGVSSGSRGKEGLTEKG